MKKEALTFLIIGVLLFLLWNTPVIYPLRIFVVFLHELSHGIAAWLTGGTLLNFVVESDEGGHAISAGGSEFLILNAGYLGSLISGGMIMIAASRTRWDKTLSFILGIGVVVCTAVYVRNLFGVLYGLAFGAALALSGYYLSEKINDRLLRTVGFAGCIYAVLDISSDVLRRSELRSDARMLAELTGIPTLVWGGIWMLLALAGTALMIYLSLPLSVQSKKETGVASAVISPR